MSEIFGFISEAHNTIYNTPISIKHEVSRFEATRKRMPLLIGWHSVIDADPQLLLDKGYDKVIYISRGLTDLCKALALYHRKAKTPEELIQLSLKEPDFFTNIKRKWDILEKDISDPRYLKISLDDWNNHTYYVYNIILDFLGFPRRKRPLIIPVKVERNFEAYSCSFITPYTSVCEKIEVLK